MPEISTVTHEQRQDSSRPITPSGLQEPDVIQYFFYEGPNHVDGILDYVKDYKGRMVLSQSLLGRVATAPLQEEVIATRPVMRNVEIALEAQCGLSNLTSRIKEWCHGVQCPRIP
jgi:hypothetical protein